MLCFWSLAGARVPRCRAWAVVSDNYCWCMERRGAQSGQQPAHTSQGFHVNIKHMPGIWYNFLSLVPTMTMPGARTLHTDTGHSQNSQHSCCWIWSTDKFLSLSRPGTISFFQTHEASGRDSTIPGFRGPGSHHTDRRGGGNKMFSYSNDVLIIRE